MSKPKTIWSPDAMPLVPTRFRNLYRVVLPLIDLGVIVFGMAALIVGSRIVGDFTIPVFLPLWASLIILGAMAAVVGLVLLRDRLELMGITAATLGLIVYAGLCVLYIMGGSVTSILTLILVVVRVVFYLWRFLDLLGQMERTEAKKAVDTGGIKLAGQDHQ